MANSEDERATGGGWSLGARSSGDGVSSPSLRAAFSVPATTSATADLRSWPRRFRPACRIPCSVHRCGFGASLRKYGAMLTLHHSADIDGSCPVRGLLGRRGHRMQDGLPCICNITPGHEQHSLLLFCCFSLGEVVECLTDDLILFHLASADSAGSEACRRYI